MCYDIKQSKGSCLGLWLDHFTVEVDLSGLGKMCQSFDSGASYCISFLVPTWLFSMRALEYYLMIVLENKLPSMDHSL